MGKDKVEQVTIKQEQEEQEEEAERTSRADKTSSESEQSQEEDIPQCYDSPHGYVVTVLPDDNNITEHLNNSPSKLTPSPIRYAFHERYLQSARTRPHQSKSSRSSRSHHLGGSKSNNTAIVEYDEVLDVTGDTVVAILPNTFWPHVINSAYEYDATKSEESVKPHPSTDSKGILVVCSL